MQILSLYIFSLTVVLVGNRKRGIIYLTCRKNKISLLCTSHQIVLVVAEVTKNLVCQSELGAFRITSCVCDSQGLLVWALRLASPLFCHITALVRAFCWALLGFSLLAGLLP